jgi:penicillin amidase
MRGLKRLAAWTASLVITLVVLVVVAGFWSSRRPFPIVDGEITVPGLAARVDVIRDPQGVPHIYASTAADLFLAQGYVHAQDRFWQMDVWRHIGAGRLSEMFGEDQVETDVFLRTMGWDRLAADQLATASDEARAVLDAYTAGVNAYLRERSPSEIALEYTILELANHSYDPAPWTPVDTLTWGKVMAWDLRGNMDGEIDRALLLGRMTPDELQALYPPYPADHPVIATDGPARPGPGITPPVVTSSLALADLRAGAERLDALTGGGGDGIGSNSWVVSGALTDTGSPLLANDPHLGIQIPSIWYQVGLHCTPVTEDCPYDVAGFSFAGVPGVVIGHNRDIAWGLTNLGPDVMDLYVERVDPTNSDRYEVNGEFVPMEVRREVIEVAGGDAVTIDVRATRHGPVVSGVYGRLDDFARESGLDTPDPHVIALRWTALDAGPAIVEPLLALNMATNWNEFRAALELFEVPAQNVIYADRLGNIGYQTPGRIPIRAAGDGRLPVPGWTDDYEWTGFIPFAELPTVFNPPEGYIVTANNAVVDGRYPDLITYDWNYGHRARRIVDMIQATDSFDIETVAAMQNDTYNLNGEWLTPLLLDLDLRGAAPAAQEAQRVLATWSSFNEKDSAGAAIFEATWSELLDAAFSDDLPEGVSAPRGGRWYEAVLGLAAQPEHRLWDDAATPQRETRDDILRSALIAAVEYLDDRFGGEPIEWRWGDLHRATFENQTLGRSGIGIVEARLNRGPVRVGGGTDIVNATGWTPEEGFEVDWVPSMRMIVDVADWDRSITVHTTGQSGHAYHPHYTSMIQPWADGEYYPMRFSEAAVSRDSADLLQLVPPELGLDR